jgi:molybdenum cofactor guanylyltransferase
MTSDQNSLDDLIGVVLCGGESRRMGHDKGSLLRDGAPWALIVARLLDALNIPVFFSINAVQQTPYASFIPPGQLIVDDVPLAGPMTGLLSTHKQLPSKDILLLACDMLDLDQATIVNVLEARKADDRYDFYVYGEAGFAQPFCGIYSARGLAPVYRSAASLPDISLQSLLRNGRSLFLEIERGEAFGNYNTLP